MLGCVLKLSLFYFAGLLDFTTKPFCISVVMQFHPLYHSLFEFPSPAFPFPFSGLFTRTEELNQRATIFRYRNSLLEIKKVTDSYPTGACESPLASVASISSALRMNSFPFAVSLVKQKNKTVLKKSLQIGGKKRTR